MITLYKNATYATPAGLQTGDLAVNQQTGKLISPQGINPARKIDASSWFIYPALINAHDHLEFNHYPRTRWRERYDNASQWADDMQPHLDQEPFLSLRKISLQTRCWVGGLKNLLSGVVTVVHHNPYHAPLREPDFPVQVVYPYGWAHSFYRNSERVKWAYWRTWRGKFFIHLAEGTDEAANLELNQLARLGCLTQHTILIHGVGLRGDYLRQAIHHSGGLVWCPSSNFFLLGQTAQIQAWFEAGKLMLGSDSRLTADGDLLDELRAAHQTGQLTPEDLFHLVTDAPARLLGLQGQGQIKIGNWAQLMAIRCPAHGDYYRALVEAHATDMEWVMRRGRILWEKNEQTANVTYQEVGYQLDSRLYQLSGDALSMVGLERLQG